MIAPSNEEREKSEDQLSVPFEYVQKFFDVYDASCAILNDSLADPNTYYTDIITGH